MLRSSALGQDRCSLTVLEVVEKVMTPYNYSNAPHSVTIRTSVFLQDTPRDVILPELHVWEMRHTGPHSFRVSSPYPVPS